MCDSTRTQGKDNQYLTGFPLRSFCFDKENLNLLVTGYCRNTRKDEYIMYYKEEIVEYGGNVNIGIGQRIQEARLNCRMSGAELGAYINISANQISRIETGQAKCKLEHLFIICQVLECSADYILYGKDENAKITYHQKSCLDALLRSFK